MFNTLAKAFSGKLAKSLVSLWTKDASVLAVAFDLGADFFDKRLDDYQQTRKLERFFQEVEDEVFDSIQAFVASEFRNKRSGDVNLVVERALNFTCSEEFLKICIQHGFRTELIMEDYVQRNKDEPKLLSVDPNLFFSLGKHVVAKVLTSVEAFPSFSTETLKGILEDTSELLDRMARLELKIDEIHSISARPIAANDVLYKNAIISRLGKINIIGVDTSGLSKHYDLSLAYVSLSITGRESKETESSYKTISLALKNPQPMTVVVGEPGSGKTTLLSWLAIEVARRSLQQPLAFLNELFPVFVRLRDFAGKKFPTGVDLVKSSLGVHGSKIDEDWIKRCLQSKKILFLLDGYDELPLEGRRRAEQWMRGLLDTWTDSKVILTSRPYAADELGELIKHYGKPQRELIVEPMTLDQVGLLISRWYKAYQHQVSHSKQAEQEELELLKSRLIKQVLSKSVLRNIVRNPLICSLLCFVNTDRKGIVPNDRAELYKIATSALITRRDAERGIEFDEGADLSERQRVRILSIIAEYFYQRKSFQLSTDSVEHRLAEYLPALGIPASKSSNIVSFLSQRSHVLRSPSVGMLDFAHKTFQEYFFAIRLVEKGMIEHVRDVFVDPDFEVVCAFTMSLATPDFADTLVGAILIGLEDLSPHDRRRSLLLLQGSIRNIAEMSPELRKEVHGFLAEIVPPRSMLEADDLASSGSVLVEPLSEFATEEYRDVWHYCVATLVNSMEPDALFALQKFAELNDSGLDKAIVKGRALFPRSDYTKIVLSSCKSLVEFEAINIDDIAIVNDLPRLSRLVLNGKFSQVQLDTLVPARSIEHLVIHRTCEVASFDFLTRFPSVKVLEIYGSDTLSPLEYLKIGQLRELESLKIHSNSLEDLSFIRKLPRLELVDFAESLNFSDLSPLKFSNSIHEYILPYSWMYDEFDDSSHGFESSLIGEKVREEGEGFFEFIGDIDEYDELEFLHHFYSERPPEDDEENLELNI
jgi:energy-coupling factor transporter ATP-binding protein EcfA2